MEAFVRISGSVGRTTQGHNGQMPQRSDIDLRTAPQQARSRATFESILAGAAELLDEAGVRAFNTNALSERTGVSVRAIYRYFPNREAIIAELARRISQQASDAIGEVGDFADPALDWRELWSGYLAAFVRTVWSLPGGRTVVLAMRDDPVLRAIDDAVNAEYVAGIAEALVARRPALSPELASVIATTLLASTVAVLDEALAAGGERQAQIQGQLVRMHLLYLAEVLDD